METSLAHAVSAARDLQLHAKEALFSGKQRGHLSSAGLRFVPAHLTNRKSVLLVFRSKPMSGQTITIRGSRTRCWIVNRFSSDEANWFRQSCEEEWFDFLAEHFVLAYSEVSGSEVAACPTAHFVFRRAPIVC